MTPDSARRRPRTAATVRSGPPPNDEHDIVYFRRHRDDDPAETVPGRTFLRACPPSVRAKFAAILVAVAAAPPRRFAGGGYWEAMHGTMTGWFEVRVDGPRRHHYRLYCLLDYSAANRPKPLLAVVTGLDKPFRTTLPDADYANVRRLGTEYLSRNPRSLS